MIISSHNIIPICDVLYDDLHWVRVTWNLLMMNSNKRNIIETGNDAQTVYWLFLQVHLTTKEVCVLCMSYLSLLVFSLLIIYLFIFYFFRCLCSFGWTNLRESMPKTIYHSFFSFSVWEYKLSFVVHSACKWEIVSCVFRNRILELGTVLIIGYQSSNLRINASRENIFVMSTC